MTDAPKDISSCDTAISICLERRAAVRYRLRTETISQLTIAKSFRSMEGLVLDLSTTGIGIAVPFEVEVGTKVFIELNREPPANRIELIARVVRTARHGSGGWFIGCAFREPLTEAQVQALR